VYNLTAPATITSVAFGRDQGNVIATGCDDNVIYLWQTGAPNCQGAYHGHNSVPTAIAFDTKSKVLVSGSSGGSLRMWDIVKEVPVRVFNSGHRTQISCLDHHPFGDFLISGSQDTYIKVWDVKNKVCLQTYKEHSRAVNVVKFSPDGRWAASGAGDGLVKLWDLTAGKCLRELACHTGEITSIQFHPREFLLAVGSTDRTFSLWDLDRFELMARSAADTTPVQRLYFLPNRNGIAMSTSDTLKVYDCSLTGTLHAVETVGVDWPQLSDLHVSEDPQVASGLQFEGSRVSVSTVKLGVQQNRNSIEVKNTPKPKRVVAHAVIAPPEPAPGVAVPRVEKEPTRRTSVPRAQPEPSRPEPEEELLSSMLNQSTNMKRLLDARLAQIRMIRSLWSRDVKNALTHIHQLLDSGSEDVGAVVDFLGLMQNQRMKEKVSFENITLLLGAVQKILNGSQRYERYLLVVMKSARCLNNIFKARIENVLRAERHVGIGVDISMEQRLEKARAARQVIDNIAKAVSQYINRSDLVGEEARACAQELAMSK
jgi:katanin p80 WD40 repeat-containing subunit B1